MLFFIPDYFVTSTVAFKARLATDTAVTIGTAIMFTNVMFNEGGAYSPDTGMFTASVSGIYMFSLALCAKYQTTVVISIMIEGKKYTMTTFYGDSLVDKCLSADTVAIVTAGQRVWVEGLSGTTSS